MVRKFRLTLIALPDLPAPAPSASSPVPPAPAPAPPAPVAPVGEFQQGGGRLQGKTVEDLLFGGRLHILIIKHSTFSGGGGSMDVLIQNPQISKLHLKLLEQFEKFRTFTISIKPLLPNKRTKQPGTYSACHAQSLAATNRVTEQLNWLTVESFYMSCSISWMASLVDKWCAFGPRKASKVEKPSSRGVSSLHRWSLMLLPVLWLMPLRSVHTCICVYSALRGCHTAAPSRSWDYEPYFIQLFALLLLYLSL